MLLGLGIMVDFTISNQIPYKLCVVIVSRIFKNIPIPYIYIME